MIKLAERGFSRHFLYYDLSHLMPLVAVYADDIEHCARGATTVVLFHNSDLS